MISIGRPAIQKYKNAVPTKANLAGQERFHVETVPEPFIWPEGIDVIQPVLMKNQTSVESATGSPGPSPHIKKERVSATPKEESEISTPFKERSGEAIEKPSKKAKSKDFRYYSRDN